MIFEALDNILSESNQESFDSLHEVGVGSQAVLMNAESFGLFAARVLAIDQEMESGTPINTTGENMGIGTVMTHFLKYKSYQLLLTVLRVQALTVEEDTQYSFPSPEELKGLALPNATLANISISPSFLAQEPSGEKRYSTMFFMSIASFVLLLLPFIGQESMSVVVASILFQTLKLFLPATSSDRCEKMNTL